MITSIKKLKSFGIYEDFNWDKSLPSFSKFNLIYGWNRSGKTTISRIFSSCEKKILYDEINFKQYPEDGEYELKLSDNTTLKSSNVGSNNLNIKVFNQDFIESNIFFRPSNSKCIPIVYISEEDIRAKKRLEKLLNDQIYQREKYIQLKKQVQILTNSKNSFLTGLGREISNILFDKTYNKTKVESKIESIGIDKIKQSGLTEDDRKKNKEISRNESPGVEINELKRFENVDFPLLFQTIKKLINKTITSSLLERLKDHHDPDNGLDEELNSWVKKGFEIHKERNLLDKCIFCNSEISAEVIQNLARHFSRDYEKLQGSIEAEIFTLNSYKLDSIVINQNDIYFGLDKKVTSLAKNINEIIKKQNEWLEHSITLLELKIRNPFDPEIVEMVHKESDFREDLNNLIESINKILKEHNFKIKNHSTEVNKSKEKLELDSISSAIITQKFEKTKKELFKAVENENKCQEIIDKNTEEIKELQQKTSNISLAIKKINKHLKNFFGEDELKLGISEDNKGYVIKRNKNIAKNLSEGEKTAIAFSYFMIKVKEKDFNLNDGIIFIDDPISSFDSNFIYHCFALITTHFTKVKQLFISTHNFQLFNLVKDWLINKNKHTKKGRNVPCCFYMIENYTDENDRKARIVELDETLREFRSEYHFLFSLLNKFKSENPNYADSYTISNVARRFFDIFADFKIPNSKNQRQKMETIVKNINETLGGKNIIAEEDWLKAFKLINEFSHNHNPISTIEHIDKSESGKAISVLLDIVKKSDPKHYEILESNIVI